jgi:transmembrane sensor
MDSTKIEHEAAAWLALRDTGAWSEPQERAFAEWQAQSTAHQIAVIRMNTIWQRADRLQALGVGVPRGQIPPPGSWRLSPFSDHHTRHAHDAHNLKSHVRSPASRLPRWRALAATLLLGAGAAICWYFAAYAPSSYRSQIGETKRVAIGDGSVVTLNTNSAIHVALTAAERRVDLDRGEAFFEVAKDPRRPFTVNAAGRRITAVGTKFSVFRGDLDTRVVVTEGQVKIEELRAGVAVGPTTQVAAGSVARAGSAGVLVKHSSVAEAETYMTWRSGYIALRDTELAAAVAEFNRYNHKQLVIADPAIADVRIGGNLRATSVDAFVRVLEQGFPIRADDQGDRIVLTEKASQH